jgi:Uncharacterized conserved protein
MGFADNIRTLGNQIEERRKHVVTEEAVKQALILPFLALLGFDIYNPAELIPEYKAGWAKVSEKIDYCLQIHGKPVLFVEAKGPNEPLTNYDAQLAKYFNSTPEVKFAIITNGIQYRFFTDLQEPNMLDKKPFFEFDFERFGDTETGVLERFRKDVFNMDSLVGYAEDLVFLGSLKSQFKRLLREPSDDFISFAVKEAQIVETRVTQKVIDRFRPLVKESINAAILEIVQQSLLPQAAVLEPVPSTETSDSEPPIADEDNKGVVTTEEELRAFEIIRELVSPHVPEPEKLKANDTGSYFSVQYGVTTRWFCRMLIQDREKKTVALRLPIDRVRELAPKYEWQEAPAYLGLARTQVDSVEEIANMEAVLAEAVKQVLPGAQSA